MSVFRNSYCVKLTKFQVFQVKFLFTYDVGRRSWIILVDGNLNKVIKESCVKIDFCLANFTFFKFVGEFLAIWADYFVKFKN